MVRSCLNSLSLLANIPYACVGFGNVISSLSAEHSQRIIGNLTLSVGMLQNGTTFLPLPDQLTNIVVLSRRDGTIGLEATIGRTFEGGGSSVAIVVSLGGSRVGGDALALDLPDQKIIYTGTPWVKDVLLGLCILSVVAVGAVTGFVVRHHNHSIIKASQRLFLVVMLFGLALVGAGAAVTAWRPLNNAVCVAEFWLVHSGFAFLFGALVAKTWRVAKFAINAKRMKKTIISNTTVAKARIYVCRRIE